MCMLQCKTLSIPNVFGVSIVTFYMYMDRLVFMGEEKKYKSVLSK